MLRRVVVRVIAALLILNGLAGIGGVWLGWQVLGETADDLREASMLLPVQQDRLVGELRQVSATLGSTAEATDGFAQSMDRAQGAVLDGSVAAADLGDQFGSLASLGWLDFGGTRPLEPLGRSFAASATSFWVLSSSLGRTAESLADNTRDTARVAEDLRRTHSQLETLITTIETARPRSIVGRGLGGLEMAVRGLLGLLLLQAILSMLTGLGLLLLVGPRRAKPGPAAASA